MRSRVAIVAREPELRLLAARAFDAAPPDWTVRLFEQAPPDVDATVVCGDVDAQGIRFDPAQPEQVLAEVARALSRPAPGRSVLVVGACGGAGTTTVALHLSSALSKQCSTCYLELDRNRGGRHRLGLQAEVPTWADAGETEESVLRAALPVEGSFRVLLRPELETEPDEQGLIARCENVFSRVVVDVGVGLPPEPLSNALAILVMTPSIVSAHRAQELLAREPDTPWAIVTNRLGPGSETTRHMLESALGRRITLELPCTPSLRDREDEGRLLDRTWSRWCSRIDRLAGAVAKP